MERLANCVQPTISRRYMLPVTGEFVELSVRNSEAYPAAVLMTFLCGFGIEVGPGPFLMVGDPEHHEKILWGNCR